MRGSGCRRERELAEQSVHPFGVAADAWVDLGVGPLEVGIGYDPGAAVAGAGDEHHIEIPVSDHPIQVRVDEVEPGRGAPVSKKSRLDVFWTERLSEQCVVEKIDLANREVVGRSPVGIDLAELFWCERAHRSTLRRMRTGQSCLRRNVSYRAVGRNGSCRTPSHASSRPCSSALTAVAHTLGWTYSE